MYKYEFGIIPLALHNLFEKNSYVHTYYTRHRNKLRPALANHAISLYMSGTMFVTILSLMCPFYRSKNILSYFVI